MVRGSHSPFTAVNYMSGFCVSVSNIDKMSLIGWQGWSDFQTLHAYSPALPGAQTYSANGLSSIPLKLHDFGICGCNHKPRIRSKCETNTIRNEPGWPRFSVPNPCTVITDHTKGSGDINFPLCLPNKPEHRFGQAAGGRVRSEMVY